MATDRRGASWLRRERLTTSAVDVDPETYKKLLPEKKSILGKWFQRMGGKRMFNLSGDEFRAMKGTMKANSTWVWPKEKKSVFFHKTGHDLARDYGMSEAAGRYGTALQAKAERSRKIRRADKGIARKY